MRLSNKQYNFLNELSRHKEWKKIIPDHMWTTVSKVMDTGEYSTSERIRLQLMRQFYVVHSMTNPALKLENGTNNKTTTHDTI